MMDNKKIGYQSEKIVEWYYISKWYTVLAKNFTVPWWEIDIIVENDQNLVFIEVKTINTIDDIDGYVTKKKISILDRTVESYLIKNPSDKEISIDAAFVKNNQIVEIYENITNN